MIHSALLYIGALLTSATNSSQNFETHIRFRLGFHFELSIVWEDTATSMMGESGGYLYFSIQNTNWLTLWNTGWTVDISGTVPIFKVGFQLQLGSYWLEIGICVASIGGDTGSNNEGTHSHFSDSIFQADSPVTHNPISQLREHKSCIDTVRCRTVIGYKNTHDFTVKFEKTTGTVYKGLFLSPPRL